RRLPGPGRAEEDHRAGAVLGDREPERRALAQDLFLPDELVERAGPEAERERRDFVHSLQRGVGEEVAHSRKYAPSVPAASESLVRKVNVVYLYVADMRRSVGFYRDQLGIPLEGDGDWQEATLGDTRFALHKAHEGIGE